VVWGRRIGGLRVRRGGAALRARAGAPRTIFRAAAVASLDVGSLGAALARHRPRRRVLDARWPANLRNQLRYAERRSRGSAAGEGRGETISGMRRSDGGA